MRSPSLFPRNGPRGHRHRCVRITVGGAPPSWVRFEWARCLMSEQRVIAQFGEKVAKTKSVDLFTCCSLAVHLVFTRVTSEHPSALFSCCRALQKPPIALAHVSRSLTPRLHRPRASSRQAPFFPSTVTAQRQLFCRTRQPRVRSSPQSTGPTLWYAPGTLLTLDRRRKVSCAVGRAQLPPV